MERRDFLRLGGAALLAVAGPPQPASAAPVPVSDWHDVKQFGARGDGRTDDTAAIAGAIRKAVAAGGGVVWFPAGTYLTSTQQLPGAVTLQGTGWQSVLKLLPGSNRNLVESPQGRSNYYGVVRDLCLDGNRDENKSGDVVNLSGATSYRLEGLRIKNAPRHGIALSGEARYPTVAPWIVNVSIVNCTGNGIQPSGFTCDCKVHNVDIGLCDKGVILPSSSFLSDVTIWQCNTGLYGYWAANSHLHMVRCERSKYSGLRFDGCTDLMIDQCRSYENNQGGGTSHGFQFAGTKDHPCLRLTLNGCAAGLTGSGNERQLFGFSDNGSAFVDYVIVQGCIAAGNARGAYQLSGVHSVVNGSL